MIADRITIGLLLVLLGCGSPAMTPPPPQKIETAPAQPPPATPPKDWSVEITTSGGIHGAGAGGVLISSDGTLKVMRQFSRSWCRPAELGAQRETIERVVAQARPETWTACYDSANPVMQCCDHFRYTLEFNRTESDDREVTYKTTWQGAVGYFPEDLGALFRSVWQLREQALKSCPEK